MEWISVKDKLPEYNTPVLACNADGICADEREPVVAFLEYDDKNWYCSKCCFCEKLFFEKLKITHWKKLDEIPHE